MSDTPKSVPNKSAGTAPDSTESSASPESSPTPSPSSSSSAPPVEVSRFEANLIRILRFFLKGVPSDQGMRLVNEKLDHPPKLSDSAFRLIEDSLSKGIVLYLARAGGWKRDRFRRKDQATFGRLWERRTPAELPLVFSSAVPEFLCWATANRVRETRPFWRTAEQGLTPADRLLFFLAYEALRIDAEVAAAMRQSAVFSENLLIRLTYPFDFADTADRDPPEMDGWFTEPACYILEAMQPTFETRWLDMENAKSEIGDWTVLGRRGSVQTAVLSAFLAAADRHGRRDLVRFVMAVLKRIFGNGDMPLKFWMGGLQGSGPPRLAERLQIQQNACGVVRQAVVLRGWERSARRAGFYDDDYAAAKFWLSEWERFDFGTVVERADRVLEQLEPLRGGESAPR